MNVRHACVSSPKKINLKKVFWLNFPSSLSLFLSLSLSLSLFLSLSFSLSLFLPSSYLQIYSRHWRLEKKFIFLFYFLQSIFFQTVQERNHPSLLFFWKMNWKKNVFERSTLETNRKEKSLESIIYHLKVHSKSSNKLLLKKKFEIFLSEVIVKQLNKIYSILLKPILIL